jgi:acetoin utilization protein AcuB
VTEPARTVDPEAGVGDAAASMAEAKVGCLPVIEDGKLVGLLTATDVLAHDVRDAFDAPASGADSNAGSVMTPDPLTASPEEPLLDAASRMSQRGIRHLPVVNAARQVQGMLTDRDVRSAIGDPRRVLASEAARRRLGTLRVRDAMTIGPLSIEQNAPVADVARYFLEHRVGAIPVVDMDDGDRLVGIVSYVDVIRALLPPSD